jgi:hypothetical protein
MKFKKLYTNDRGFALITAMVMLFAATVLGLMAINSSDVEIMLSGAMQRYERNFNTSEGGVSAEATAVGTAATITRQGETRSYVVSNPTITDQVLSPTTPSDTIFDPGDDLSDTIVYSNADPDTWPIENLLHSDTAGDNPFDYHYRTVYEHSATAPKGYDATKFSSYLFQISAQRTTLIEVGGEKVGPQMSL